MTKKGYKRKFFDFRYVARENRKSLILACILFWSILCYLFVSHYLIGTMVVEGNSMRPTLQSGERHMFHRWAYLWSVPERGDIVAFDDPYDSTLSVKRIIALPGENIQIRHGQVFVNNQKLREPYLSLKAWTSAPELGDDTYGVDPEHYFVMGDNRSESEDSRNIGAIPLKSIAGKINIS